MLGIVTFTDNKPLTYTVNWKFDKALPRQARDLYFINQFATDFRHVTGKYNVPPDSGRVTFAYFIQVSRRLHRLSENTSRTLAHSKVSRRWSAKTDYLTGLKRFRCLTSKFIPLVWHSIMAEYVISARLFEWELIGEDDLDHTCSNHMSSWAVWFSVERHTLLRPTGLYLHRQFGTAIRCHENGQWRRVFKTVLLGIRVWWRRDLEATAFAPNLSILRIRLHSSPSYINISRRSGRLWAKCGPC